MSVCYFKHYVFDTKVCETCEKHWKNKEIQEVRSKTAFSIPWWQHGNRTFALHYLKSLLKSQMGKEAMQGSFDSFWLWPRKWNYWKKSKLFFKRTAVRRLCSRLNTIKIMEEKIKLIIGQEQVGGVYRFLSQWQNMASEITSVTSGDQSLC